MQKISRFVALIFACLYLYFVLKVIINPGSFTFVWFSELFTNNHNSPLLELCSILIAGGLLVVVPCLMGLFLFFKNGSLHWTFLLFFSSAGFKLTLNSFFQSETLLRNPLFRILNVENERIVSLVQQASLSLQEECSQLLISPYDAALHLISGNIVDINNYFLYLVGIVFFSLSFIITAAFASFVFSAASSDTASTAQENPEEKTEGILALISEIKQSTGFIQKSSEHVLKCRIWGIKDYSQSVPVSSCLDEDWEIKFDTDTEAEEPLTWLGWTWGWTKTILKWFGGYVVTNAILLNIILGTPIIPNNGDGAAFIDGVPIDMNQDFNGPANQNPNINFPEAA